MEFIDAAAFFNDDPVYDGYAPGAALFFCHTTPHDDHTSSGATSRRRTLTTEDSSVMPARRVIQLYGDRWLVSTGHPDTLTGEVVRRSYGIKRSTGLMAALTPAQAAAGAAGTPIYAHREYYRDNQNARTESEWDVMWNIFTGPDEPATKGMFLRQGGTLFRVRSNYPSIEELNIAEADQLDADALQAVTFTTSVHNLVTDQMTPTSLVATAIQTDALKFYHFRTQAEAAQQPGDRTVFVSQSIVTPRVGGIFNMLGADWRILAVVPDLDSYALHARLA